MKKYLFKAFFFLLAIIVVFFLLFNFSREFFESFNLNHAFVSFLDVSQGDAILIRTPTGKNILIDAGPNNITLERIGENLPYFSRELDYVIVSHYHDDHIGALRKIFKLYKIKNFVYQANGKSSKTFDDLLLEISKHKETRIISLEKDLEIFFNKDCYLYIFNPLALLVPEDENNSLLTKLNCNNKKFLFSGDNELSVESAMLKAGIDLKSDVLKASHHGSKTSNSVVFLKTINPEYFVISVGVKNRFNHPAPNVIDLVKSANIKIKRTDLEGSIKFSLTD